MIVRLSDGNHTRKEHLMGRLLPGLAMALVMALAVAGCQSNGAKDHEAAESPRPAFNPDPDSWAKGEVFRVWPYRNDEVEGMLGMRDGVSEGDVLILMRDGVVINSVVVMQVQERTFLGRVTDHGPTAVRPQVGDWAIRGPQPYMPAVGGTPPTETPASPEEPPVSPMPTPAPEGGGEVPS
jgi:hypothetical protein